MSAPVGLKQVEAPGNRVTHLYGRVTLDASGQQVVATTSVSKGIPMRFSIARTSAGVYTITLVDKWVTLLNINVITLVAGASASGRQGVWKVDSEAVSASPATIVIRNEAIPVAGVGVAQDLGANAVLLIMIALDRGRI
jgi:hypothetical protein